MTIYAKTLEIIGKYEKYRRKKNMAKDYERFKYYARFTETTN